MSAASEYVSPAEDWYRGQYRQQQERCQERRSELPHGASDDIVSYPLASTGYPPRPLLPHQQEYIHYDQSPTTQNFDSLSSRNSSLAASEDAYDTLQHQYSPSYFLPPFYDQQLPSPHQDEFPRFDQHSEYQQEGYYAHSQYSTSSSTLHTPFFYDSLADPSQFYDQQSTYLDHSNQADRHRHSRIVACDDSQDIEMQEQYAEEQDCSAYVPDFSSAHPFLRRRELDQDHPATAQSLLDADHNTLPPFHLIPLEDSTQLAPMQIDSPSPYHPLPQSRYPSIDYSYYTPTPPFPSPFPPLDIADSFQLEIPLLVQELEWLASKQEHLAPYASTGSLSVQSRSSSLQLSDIVPPEISPPDFASSSLSLQRLSSMPVVPAHKLMTSGSLDVRFVSLCFGPTTDDSVSQFAETVRTFIAKLAYLLRHPEEYGDVIWWKYVFSARLEPLSESLTLRFSITGDRFILAYQSNKLLSQILPKYFGHESSNATCAAFQRACPTRSTTTLADGS